MRVGSNLPYEGMNFDDLRKAENLLELMRADEVLITSHIPLPLLIELLFWNLPKLVHVRAKTGPSNQGVYPENILHYQEWEDERTLEDTIFTLQGKDLVPHIILGNEPDIEMAMQPENSDMWIYEAETYRQWYENQARQIKSVYGDRVLVSPAPLSQGWHDRFIVWYNTLYPTYRSQYVDFIAEHLYLGPEDKANEWHQRYVYFLEFNKEIHVTEFNDNGTGREVTTYRDACGWYDGHVECLSFFTLEGGTNTRENRPLWWFITEEEAIQIGHRGQKVEEPKKMDVNDGFIQLWQAHAEVTYWIGEDFSGIFKVWAQNPENYGSPIADEYTTTTGRVIQAFARGVYEWTGSELVPATFGS